MSTEQDTQPEYDVSISFLVADEKIASDVKSGLAGLKVFFYPHNQEELIGTNGIESMREPFLGSRVNVILFRERYGKTPWTGVELAAIQDSCLKSHYQSLVFVQLDKKDAKPPWLPDTHIRCNLGDFTLDQLAGAIKMRVQERGGHIQKPSSLDTAKRLRDEQLLREDTRKFFRDHPFVKETEQSVLDLMKKVVQMGEQFKAEAGIQLFSGYERYGAGYRAILRYGRVTLEVWWHQIYTNTIEEVALECTEYNGFRSLDSEKRLRSYEPQKWEQRKYLPALNSARELRWKEEGKPDELLSNDDVVERIGEQFLGFVDALNRGDIPPIDYY